MYPACLSQISHFDIATRYAGPTAAACWRKKVYPIPKRECELASKPSRLQPEDRQPESPITAYPSGYISETFYPKLKQSPNLKLDIVHEHKNCSQDVPPLRTAQRSARRPPEVACRWEANIWAPKRSVSEYTTASTLLLCGRSFTDIPAEFVADGFPQRL